MKMERTSEYILRPVNEEDDALLLEVYSSTRADEMALVPWDDVQKKSFLQMQFSAQKNHYRTYFPNAKHEMILVDEEPIGRVYVDRRETEIRILDMTLLPSARGRGVGSQIIRELMKEANDQNKSLSIYVESFNRSLGLFQRLGFVKVEENGASFLMEWRAAL